MAQGSRVVSPSLPQVFPIPLHLNRMSLKIPKGVVKIRKSKNKRQHIPQKKKYKRTNNDLQNIHIELKLE